MRTKREHGRVTLGDLPEMAALLRHVNHVVKERYRKCANQRAYRARLKAKRAEVTA